MTDSQHEAWLANREERLTEGKQQEQEAADEAWRKRYLRGADSQDDWALEER